MENMDEPIFKTVAVIGTGVLGGSIGLAVKAADERITVIGIGRRKSTLERAIKAEAIDDMTLDTAKGVSQADIVILATPISAYEKHLLDMRDALPRNAVVTDVGSTKAIVVKLAQNILGKDGPFVGSHPMAGSERRGVEFARADLFKGATCIVTPTQHTKASCLKKVVKFWKMLGANVVRLSPQEHDKAVAYVSHLPHILAALIIACQNNKHIKLAGKGFIDTTRVASGSPDMWREIILTNRKAILSAIDQADEQLMYLRDLIEAGDGEAIEQYLARAKARRDALIAKQLKHLD